MKCFIFDLDGTLTDPKLGICSCVQYAMEAAGMEPPPIDELTDFIGPPLVVHFKERLGVDDNTALFMLDKYRERFSAVGIKQNEIYPGIAEMLEALYSRGAIIALGTSKPVEYASVILENFNIGQYFHVLAGNDLKESRSTKSLVLEYALSRLEEQFGLKPCDCLMVGDRRYDIEAAGHFGMAAVAVGYGYGSADEIKKADPAYYAKSVDELTKLLLSLLSS